jgi:hypothetical protein
MKSDIPQISFLTCERFILPLLLNNHTSTDRRVSSPIIRSPSPGAGFCTCAPCTFAPAPCAPVDAHPANHGQSILRRGPFGQCDQRKPCIWRFGSGGSHYGTAVSFLKKKLTMKSGCFFPLPRQPPHCLSPATLAQKLHPTHSNRPADPTLN